MPWNKQIIRHRSACGDGLRRLGDKAAHQKGARPAAMDDKRLKAMLCSRKADCARCESPCAYGQEWMRRSAEREG